MPPSDELNAFPAIPLATDTLAYWTDACRRSLMFWDVLRERGNNYLEHEQSGKPPVLVFDYKLILDARRFERPANYALAAIVPPPDYVATDPKKRPFVVIDPRAGHGPGIGGSKMDSEIGIALKAGHPCYFVMFFPQPVAGQTIECVTHAERLFLAKVNELHPDAVGKPFVIGNCQGGWALMILAALAPESVGPVLLAGSPLSYWAGVENKNPLRYTGGLMGGTWMASLAGDLGNGKFDGAHLVDNFEKLDPGNTHFSKLYNLYANIDTERTRYLDFERWWGGHFLLNKEEMAWISQNLFVGNKLSAGEIIMDDGETRVDLRNIRSPIVVFASWGDNITPPQQALFWIADLYDSVEDIRDHEQTIVYFLHEQIGHLGIFVSAGVANREHTELVNALDLIDMLPPGLYEAIILDTTPDMAGLDFAEDRYVIRFEPRDISDILALGEADREGERAFELVRHVSQINQSCYDMFVSPVVTMFSSEMSATCLRNLSSARYERTLLSDSNPALKALRPLAEMARSMSADLAEDNPWLLAEKKMAATIRSNWDSYRDMRDAHYERLFKLTYESPLLAAMTGFQPDPKRTTGARPRSQAEQEFLAQKRAEHEIWFDHGSPEEGFLRLLIYVAIGNGVVDERPFSGIRRLMRATGRDQTVSLQQMKEAIRRQTFLVRMDEARALASLPALLPLRAQRQHALELATDLLALSGPINAGKQQRLQSIAQALGLDQPEPAAAPIAKKTAKPRKTVVGKGRQKKAQTT